jgi:hypothetical protein
MQSKSCADDEVVECFRRPHKTNDESCAIKGGKRSTTRAKPAAKAGPANLHLSRATRAKPFGHAVFQARD